MEMGKIIRKSVRSEHFGILQFWEFFCQPFGENTLSKNAPKPKNGKLKKLQSFLSNQITPRYIYIYIFSVLGWLSPGWPQALALSMAKIMWWMRLPPEAHVILVDNESYEEASGLVDALAT